MAKRRKKKAKTATPIAAAVLTAPAPLRALGLFSIVCLGINAIVGSGIFRQPGQLSHYLGGASWMAYGIVGVLLISVGLCFAEMGGMFDASGGPYTYAREAFGKIPAFVIGWVAWITMVVSWAGVANAIPGYIGVLWPAAEHDPLIKRAIVTALCVVPGLLNYFGVKPGAYALNTFTIAKLVPLLGFVLVGIWFVDWGSLSIVPDTSGPTGLAPLGTAMFVGLFALQGFEVAPIPAGESKNPRRDIPIAVIGSLIGCAIFYVLIQIVAFGTEPAIATGGDTAAAPWTPRPLAVAADTFVGPTGATIMAIGACVSMTGFCVGSGLATPRFLAVLADDGLFPKWIADLHPRFATPHRAILITTLATAGASFIAGFDELIAVANVAVTLQYVATCIAVIWLRRARPNAPRTYRVPFGPYAIPLFAIAVCALLISQAPAKEFLVTPIVILVGGLLALLHHTFSRR